MFLIGILGFGILLGGLAILGANQTATTPGGNVGVGTTAPIPPGGTQPPPGPVPTEKLAQIVHWSQVVNSALIQPTPPDGPWDRMQADISNNGYTATKEPGAPGEKYWCTFLVIDSYNLAGIKGLSVSSHGLVRNMRDFWQQNPPGYFYIPFNQNTFASQIVKPGYTVIRIHPNDYTLDHADVISYIRVDENGDGEIRTLDSNGFHSWVSPIHHGYPTDTSFAAPIAGFGGVTQ